MPRCIFCDSEGNSFNRIEHLVPESLGGEIKLPRGLVCDKCNNYFGRAVEQKALNAPPLSFMRASLSARNKRGRFHCHDGLNWQIEGGISEPTFIFPNSRIESLIRLGRGQIRIPQVGNASICRLMLKMGIECLALTSDFDVFDSQFYLSRQAARAPQSGLRWSMAISHLNVDQIGIYYAHNNELYYDEFVYDIDLALDTDFGMIGIQFVYGWLRFIIPLNDIGLENFDSIVYRHNFLHADENKLQVVKPDISKLD